MNATNPEDLDLGFDLEITKTTRRAAGAGTWVCGTLHGHRFEALVFPEHADNPEWEIGDSRISKLWIQRLADRRQVFNWDRGADVPAADKTVACIACHGPDLRGLAGVPPIAGRSPVYIARQLIMMQNGQRISEQSKLMMPAVEKLDLDDIIALAAYAAAQKP